jgi:subtilisin family serine protease
VILEAAPGREEEVARELISAGAAPEASYGSLLQASVPVPALREIASLPGVRLVRRPHEPLPAALSEGVGRIGAGLWHAAGYRGGGRRVGILDVGFEGYGSLVGAELPRCLEARSFRSDGDITGGGEPHGTAVAETVADVAPGACLYLANFSTEVELALAVVWLASRGVEVVNFSIVFLNTAGPGDGTGVIADVIAGAAARGILWVGSAGNFADKHWLGRFGDPDGDDVHNFGSTDETQTISATAGERIVVGLRWDDPWGASSNDYDLFLIDRTLTTVLDASVGLQTGTQDPVEVVGIVAPYTGSYHVVVARYCAGSRCPASVELDLMTSRHRLQYQVSERSLGIGPDSTDCLAVGATDVRTDVLEPYSSRGPTTDGRAKPDLTGPAGTSNSIYGAFRGTSASAPHVAGAAALALDAYPYAGWRDLRGFLESRAADMGAPGKDDLYGSGLLSLEAAPAFALASPGDGDTLACGPGAPPQTVTWSHERFDRFKVFVSADPGFPRRGSISSGEKPLRLAAWTVPARVWGEFCRRAGPRAYIRVRGIDRELSKGEPERAGVTETVEVGIEP